VVNIPGALLNKSLSSRIGEEFVRVEVAMKNAASLLMVKNVECMITEKSKFIRG